MYKLIVIYLLLITTSTFSQNFWQRINSPNPVSHIKALSINSSGHIFAATGDSGIYRSVDDLIWQKVNNGITNLNINTLCISTTGNIFAGSHGSGIFKSTNNGNFWSTSGLPNKYITKLVNTPFGIFALDGFWCSGLYRSTDEGASWVCLTCPSFFMFCVNSVVAFSSNQIVGGTGDAGVFRTTNSGNNWIASNTGLSSLNIVQMVKNSIGHVFATTTWNIYTNDFGDGIFRSTNQGQSWVRISAGLTTRRMYSIAVNSLDYLYAGATDTGGVFRSTDNGNYWSKINSGIEDTTIGVTELVINQQGYLYAAIGNKIYRSVQSTISSIEDYGIFPMEFMLSQNYPNPFNPSTTIWYDLPKQCKVKLTIYDLLGRDVAILVDEEKQPGRYEVEWNAKDYPSGVYFYRLTADQYIQTKKLVLIR